MESFHPRREVPPRRANLLCADVQPLERTVRRVKNLNAEMGNCQKFCNLLGGYNIIMSSGWAISRFALCASNIRRPGEDLQERFQL